GRRLADVAGGRLRPTPCFAFRCHDIFASGNQLSRGGRRSSSLCRKGGPQVGAVKETHLSVEMMARWLAPDLDHETVLGAVVPHVLALCPGCRESYEEVQRLQREFEHWDERVAVLEGRQAPVLFAELAGRPFEEQLAAVRGEERFQNWGFCQLL